MLFLDPNDTSGSSKKVLVSSMYINFKLIAKNDSFSENFMPAEIESVMLSPATCKSFSSVKSIKRKLES